MGGAGAGAVTGVAGRRGVCVLVDDGRDSADGLVHVECGHVAGVRVCRGLAEGESLAGLGEI